MESTGSLIVGIDIGEKVSQISYFDDVARTTNGVLFEDGRSIRENPIEASRWSDIVKDEYKGQLDDVCLFISTMIENVKRSTKKLEIAKICITTSLFYRAFLESLEVIMERIGIPRDLWQVISYEEAFAFYAFNQRKEVYSAGVMLLDYDVDGIAGYIMNMGKIKNNTIIMESSYYLKNDVIVNTFGNLEKSQEYILRWLNDIFQKHRISAIYLTGKGFEYKEFPEAFVKLLCFRRKLFAGQNIYVSGAVYSAYESVYKEKFAGIIFACHNRIATGIEIDIIERGKDKRLRIIKPGTNWYEASRQMTFVVDDVKKIEFYMKPSDGNKDYINSIDISSIPQEKGKFKKIVIDIKFDSDEMFKVTVKDKGFGEIFRSSGKVIYEQFDIV